MIRCISCNEDAEAKGTAVLINCDGDFACSESCAEKYRKDREHFLNNVIHNDQQFAAWLGVPVSDIQR
jgi:hypothetical protein